MCGIAGYISNRPLDKKILSDNSDLIIGPRAIAKRGNGFEFQLSLDNDKLPASI